MTIVIWIAFGIIAAVISHLIDPYKVRGGLNAAIMVGIIGALLGGFLAKLLLGTSLLRFDISSLIVVFAATAVFLLMQRSAFVDRS